MASLAQGCCGVLLDLAQVLGLAQGCCGVCEAVAPPLIVGLAKIVWSGEEVFVCRAASLPCLPPRFLLLLQPCPSCGSVLCRRFVLGASMQVLRVEQVGLLQVLCRVRAAAAARCGRDV